VQELLGPGAELVHHVLEPLQAGLVGLHLLGGDDRMERRPVHCDVVHDLGVHRIGQPDERKFLRHDLQRGRNVGMRGPARHGIVEGLRLGLDERDAVLAAGARRRIDDDVAVRLPGAQHLVQPVGGEVAHELVHLRRRQAGAIDLPRHVREPHPGQRAVAVEGDEFGPEEGHAVSYDLRDACSFSLMHNAAKICIILSIRAGAYGAHHRL